MEDIGSALGEWTYVLVGVMAYLETGAFVGFIAPGETAVLVGGVVAGQGQIDLLVLIGIVWLCALGGDITSFMLGRRYGRSFLFRHGRHLRITEERFEVVESYFTKWGGLTIFFGRFFGFLRPLLPFVAGASHMRLRQFIPYDVLGAGVWATVFSVLGFIFWRSFDELSQYVGRGLLIFGGVVGLVVAVIVLRYLSRHPETRARWRAWIEIEAQRPAVRPFATASVKLWQGVGQPIWNSIVVPILRAVARVSNFLYGRVTPGELGLELTSLLAMAAVGLFVFVLLATQIEAGNIPGIDTTAFSLVDSLHSNIAIDIVKVVTYLGSFPVVAVVIGATALLSILRRCWYEAATLVAGAALIAIAVPTAKNAFERMRPPDALIEVGGFSFPSGHATWATAYVACAVVLVYRSKSRWVQIGVIAAAALIMVAVALSRVYLRVHFLSDALAGIALGATIFAVCGSVALVIRFFTSSKDRIGSAEALLLDGDLNVIV